MKTSTQLTATSGTALADIDDEHVDNVHLMMPETNAPSTLNSYQTSSYYHNYKQNHQHSLTKWIYRRIRKFILLQSWTNFICFFILAVVGFLMLSSHLYVLLIHQSSTVVNSDSELSSSLDQYSTVNYSRYINELSSMVAHPSYQIRTAQINEQLRRIELSLKENRQILQSIRNSINRVNYFNKTSLHQDYDQTLFLIDGQLWQENLFYDKIFTDDVCVTRKPFIGDINMQMVYDHLEFDNLDGGVWKQGWPLVIQEEDFQKPKPKLKVFIVPHSHNDPGWIKTFDVYFSKQTQHILTNAVEFLTSHSDMKFIWAETSYLSAWWETQDQPHRQMLKQLIKEGRFEVVTGGWVMNDEANTHFWSILEQMVEGHEWLENTIGCQPKHGWAIDPFGLSSTMAYLLSGMEFRAMVIQRVHYSIKKHLAKNHQLEFLWKQHWQTENPDQKQINGDILCHVEPFYSYDIPHTCGPDPKVCCQFDFKRLPPGKPKCPWKINPQVITKDNIEERAKTLLDQYRKKSLLYRTNSLLVPLGDDFRYDDIKEWRNQYENYRLLMDYLNSDDRFNVHVQFATLNDYFESVLQEKPKEQFSKLVGDFFTYADRDDHYWSGYYTSKPFYKRFERILASHLRATEILFSMANILTENITTDKKDPFEYLTYEYMFARQNLALFQHHDGITGTAKDSVVVDYANRMLRSFTILQQVSTASLAALTNNSELPELLFMNYFSGISVPLKKHVFHLGSNSKNYFILYNSLGWSLDAQLFCFDISWMNDTMPDWCLTSIDDDNRIKDRSNIRTIQMNHIWPQVSVQQEPIANHREICFQPKLRPLSLKEYCIGNDCPCSSIEEHRSSRYFHHEKHESFVTLYNNHRDAMIASKPFDYHILSLVHSAPNTTIENEMIRLVFDSTGNHHGLLKSWSYFDLDSKHWVTMNVRLSVMTFGTRPGGKNVQKSGAYIFLPDKQDPVPFEWLGKPKVRVMIGNIESRYEWIVDEPYPVHIRFSLYRGRPTVELQTEFHLQGQKGANRELLLRFEVNDIQNGRQFYTDLNGLQIINRKRYDKIPLQGNVYPLNTMAWIEDQHHRFTIISGQPLGVTSLHSGTLEVFMDRRLSQDDSRGLNQGVLDNRYTRESFRLMLEPLKTNTSRTNPASPRTTSAQMFESQTLLNPIIGLTVDGKQEQTAMGSKPILNGKRTKELTLLKRSLPCDVHLLNLRRSINRFDEFGLWFHRTSLNCDSKCLQQPKTKKNTINLNDFVSDEIVRKLKRKIYPTGISWRKTLETENYKFLNESLELSPMQITAYRLFRDNSNKN